MPYLLLAYLIRKIDITVLLELKYDKALKGYIEKINVSDDLLRRYRNNSDLHLHVLEILRSEEKVNLIIDENSLSYTMIKATNSETVRLKVENVTDVTKKVSIESRLKSEDLCAMEMRVASEYFEHGRIDDALKSTRVLEMLKESGFYTMKLGRYFRLKAMEAIFTGQVTYILSYYRKSLNEALKEDDHVCVALTYMGLGNYFSISRNFKEAVAYYEKSILEFNEVDDKLGVAKVKVNTAYALYQLNDYWNATKINEEAINLLLKLKNNMFLQHAYLNKAIAFKEEGIYDKALESFDLANKIARITENTFLIHLSNVWITFCKIILKERDVDLKEFNEAYMYLHEEGDIGYMLSCKTVKCIYHIYKNNKEEFLKELVSFQDLLPGEVSMYQSDLISSLLMILKALSIFKADLKSVYQFFDKATLILGNSTSREEFNQIARHIFPL